MFDEPNYKMPVLSQPEAVELYGGPLDGTLMMIQSGLNDLELREPAELPTQARVALEDYDQIKLNRLKYRRVVLIPNRFAWMGYA